MKANVDLKIFSWKSAGQKNKFINVGGK